MILEEEIIFVTTSLQTKWLDYQQGRIKRFFPKSKRLIIDGSVNWPNCWFYWMDDVKSSGCKWFLHIDEDCFIEGREAILHLFEKMDLEGFSLSACSDAYHHYRGANPIGINSFFMAGKIEDTLNTGIDYKSIKYWLTKEGWRNELGIIYNQNKHGNNFKYPHKEQENGANFNYEQEFYYLWIWKLIEQNKKILYLYPFFDQRFKSTNPRIDEQSQDLAIHMWYTRIWQSPMEVHGIPNYIRYQKVEKYLNGIPVN